MAKDKQTDIWGYIPEVENDIKIIKTVCKLGGLSEDETNKEINKLKINKEKQDEYSKLLGRQNAVKYQISEKYSVGFYILAGYAIFRYYEKREYGTWETDRDSVLGRLSEGERKILFDFEAEKKEIFKKYEVYIM